MTFCHGCWHVWQNVAVRFRNWRHPAHLHGVLSAMAAVMVAMKLWSCEWWLLSTFKILRNLMVVRRITPILCKCHCLLADARARRSALLLVAKVVVHKGLSDNAKGVVLKCNQKGEDHEDKINQNSHVKPDHLGILRKDGIKDQALIVQGYTSSD